VLEKLPFGKTFAAVLFKTKDISEAALKFALHAVEALGNGLLRGIGFLGPKGVESMRGVVGSAIGVVRDSAGTLFKTTVEWMQKLPEGMLSVLDNIGRAIGTILRFIFDAYKDAATWLFSRGTELIGGLINGVKQESAFLFDYFLYIPRRIFELLSTIGSWLFEHGMMLIRGLKGGMDFSIVDVWQFYIELPGKILSWFSSAGTWLVRSGAQILEGLLSGTSSVWESAVWPWFRAVGGRVGEAVGNIGSALVGKGRDIVAGLFEGARSGWDTFAGWIGGLYGRVLGAAGNFGSILLEAGKDVIRSLIRGIDSMIGALGEKMRDVANKIGNYLPHSPAKEGPLSGRGYPLYAGQAIVRSLATGISSEAATLDAAMAGMLRPVGGSPVSLAMTGGANGGVVNNFNINAPGAYAEPITEAGLALMLRRTELQKATYVA
jgi:phage-related protein